LSDRARCWPLELPRGLGRIASELAAADLVLVDPPYGGGPARAVLDRLGVPGTLRAGCRLVLEHHGKDAIGERFGSLTRTKSKAYGETVVTTFETAADDGARAVEESSP
jgi:16S rRNA G966 N2-methylase RsmD